MGLLTFMLDLTTVNAYLTYLYCFRIVQSLVNGNQKPLTQTELRAEVVRGLVGTYSCRKQAGHPSARHCTPTSRSPGHESCNVVKRHLKCGCCGHCCIGVQGAQKKETRFGCVQCCRQLCPEKCHDEYHNILFQNKV